MNWLDVVLTTIIAVSVIVGLWKGFARTAIGFAATVAAVICALWFYGTTGFWLRPVIASKPLANVIGALLIFAAIGTMGAVVEWLAAKFLRSAHLSWLDRILGAGFGLVRGALVATMLVLLFLTFAPKPLPGYVAQSACIPQFTAAAHVLATAAPYEVRDGFRRACHDFDTVLPEHMKKRLAQLPPDGI